MSSAPTERRLAAIMFTDIVGYTALMAESEERGLRVRERARGLIGSCAGSYQGSVVDENGDELVLTFQSALDAVRCALAIQAALLDDPELQLRIGVHSGDVVFDGGRVYGDGVNVASRIRPLAEPGGICISDEVQHSIRNQPDIETVSLGEHDLMNVGRRICVHAVKVTVGLPPAPAGPGSVANELDLPGMEERIVPGFGGAPAIAVLAFDNLSEDPEQEHFADGISEDLITQLSGWRHFPVIARQSSFAYKGRTVDLKQVGRELGARYVVEGSVRKVGSRVRITAQLIDSLDGAHVWAERYDRELADLFAVQDEITHAIATSVGVEIPRHSTTRATRASDRRLSAWERVVKTFPVFDRFTKDDNVRARAELVGAMEIDPDYWLTFTWLALTHIRDLRLGWTDSRERSLAEAVLTAERSVELDPQAPMALSTLGTARLCQGETEAGIALLRRALDLNPSLPIARINLALALSATGGGEEAIGVIETSVRLSPAHRMTWVYLSAAGQAYFAAGRYEEAIDRLQRGIAVSTTRYPPPLAFLAASCGQLGRLDEARDALRRLREQYPGYSPLQPISIFPGADPEWVQRYVAGLRKAGFREE